MDDSHFRAVTGKTRSRAWPRRLLWLVLLVALAVWAALWVQRSRIEAPETRVGRFTGGGPMPVAVGTVERGELPIKFSALGTVTPLATVTVRTQITGQITRIAFQEGQRVRQGDFLAEIDPRPYQNALEQAEGALARDQALLRNAETDLARYRRLFAQDSIARQQLDTTENLVRQYQGLVKTDEAAVSNARLNLAYCRIVAPIAGRAGLRLVDQGNYIQTGDAGGIVVITQTQPISVIFTLPEDSLPPVLRRLRENATLQVVAFDRRGTRQIATGTLTTVDNQIDTATGTVKLRAQFTNDDEALFPNQFVNIRLLVDARRDAVIVPTAAVQRGAPGTYVYLLNADGTVSVRPITIGPADGERTLVESGLEVGATVVVDGADRLRDGARVTVPGAQRSGDGASPPPARTRQGGGQGGGQRGAGQPQGGARPAP